MKIKFEFERETKRMVRFQEVVRDPKLDQPAIGTLYVSKLTLSSLGIGENLEIELHGYTPSESDKDDA